LQYQRGLRPFSAPTAVAGGTEKSTITGFETILRQKLVKLAGGGRLAALGKTETSTETRVDS
jgi:hypothetical protein